MDLYEYIVINKETKKFKVITGFDFEDAKNKYDLDDNWVCLRKSIWCPM